jgi:DNA primase large subunit
MAVRRSAAPLDSASLYGEYPFLPGAESLLRDQSWTVRGLLEDRRYDPARVLGRARILAAADDPRAVREVAEFADATPEVRYLSFLFARVALACAPSLAALRRWAVAESKRASARLESLTAPEQEEEILAVAGKLQVEMAPGPGGIEIPLVDYVRLAAPIREADFRLVHQELRRGYVGVRPPRAARLLEEAIRRRLAEPLPLTEDVVQFVREHEGELLSQLAARMPLPTARAGVPGGALLADRFPPCIRKMRRTLQQGENLSHSGRFALAAFLHRAGADAETIVDAYRGAPDFDESITRYQVEHITQHDGGAGYTPPECETLRSHGLCAREGDPAAQEPRDQQRDPLCFEPRLHHPLQYYQIRGGAVLEKGEREGRADRANRPGEGPGTPGPPGRSRSTGRR